MQFVSDYDSEGNYAPHCNQCRENGFDSTRKFVDMCNSCQNYSIRKTFSKERKNAVENYIVDNS